MNKVLLFSFLARFFLTPIIVLSGKNYFKLVFILIFLDIIDCNPLDIKLFPKEILNKQQYCSKDPFYVLIDKLLDLYQYLIAIIYLYPLFELESFYMLLFFFLYRTLGVILFMINKNSEVFIFFPDLIKEYIILVALFGDKIHPIILLATIVDKIGFEYLIHKKDIMIDLYKKFFE